MLPFLSKKFSRVSSFGKGKYLRLFLATRIEREQPQFRLFPDLTFHNDRALKSVDRHFWATKNLRSLGFWAQHSVGFLTSSSPSIFFPSERLTFVSYLWATKFWQTQVEESFRQTPPCRISLLSPSFFVLNCISARIYLSSASHSVQRCESRIFPSVTALRCCRSC